MALFLAHTFLLLLASHGIASHLLRARLDRVLAAGLLAWGNIVATSLLLSCLHRLGDPAWFFRTSLLLALGSWLLARRFSPPAEAPAKTETGPDAWLLWACCLTLAPIAYAGVRLAATYEPNNYDSLAYHLPRAMYYLGQNTLAHFDTGNPRQVYFPFNYNLLQLFGLIYSPPVQVVNFINLAAWGAAGLAIYRLCRLAAIGANAALGASWLTLLSTQVLAQGTATTNDLPTGTGLLCALLFGLRWRATRLTRDALFTGLAAGLTAGSKLTVVFLGPAAALIGLALAWQHWRRGETRAFLQGLRAWLLPATLAFVLVAPFALINLAEKGEWINKTYDFTLNRPFSFACAAQTTEAYLVQFFLEPLHRFTFDLRLTEQLNTWGVRTFFPHWNATYAFSPLYLFPPDLNEDHVWFGFTGPAILLAALWCLVRWRRVSAPVLWLVILGFGWFATYFLLNKWSLYNQRYFVPAIMVLSPCLAALIEAGWSHPSFQRATRSLLGLLVVCSLWLAGVYLFHNTSRPYAPLWAGDPAPAALPVLPPLMRERLAAQTWVNIHSTDGNERIFLLMAQGPHQRFTAFRQPVAGAYNVFSEWGFVRKVTYSNIEQLSSYTVVEIPSKQTAGVEFLGTIGQGQPALDYYGLPAQADRVPSAAGNRHALVELYYGPREPNRYQRLGIRVAGLNAPDRARLQLGIEYTDGSAETLAVFTATGEAEASVTRPFRRFLVRVYSQDNGQEIGAVDLPHLFRDRPDENEAPHNPASVFADELIELEPKSLITTEGLAAAEGPYPQWNLPLIRWAKSPVLRLEIPADDNLGRLTIAFDLRLQAREAADLDVVFNGELVKSYHVKGRVAWFNQKVEVVPRPGKNVLEFRNVAVGSEPDWLDYLERYPDVKNYVVAQNLPLERGAKEHYEGFGKNETRVLHLKRRTVPVSSGEPLYFLFRSLRVEGYWKP